MRTPWIRNVACAAILAAVLVGQFGMAASDDNSRLTLQVLREEDKKPVASAHVVVRFVSGTKLFIKKKRTSWEAQTNRRGELILEDLPMGRVKVQVIAKGFQTFGDEIELSQPEQQLTILLKPPAGQVSAY